MDWGMGALLFVLAALFAAAGIVYSRGGIETLEDYISARSRFGALATGATLVATGMGSWILFGPAEAATWGGLPTLLGYALGAGAPLFAYIPLGRRIRELMPAGHSLTEYVWHRFGKGMYVFTLLVMAFYMFIFLAAEITGMALLVQMVARVPLGLTASVVLAATLAYTAYGGLRATIFTDVLQTALILPLLAVLLVFAFFQLGGTEPAVTGLSQRAPHLLNWGYGAGVQGGITFLIAVLTGNLFHQGYWQRVYAVRDDTALRQGFLWGGVAVIPIVFFLGLFGLAAVALDRADTPSIALFSTLAGSLPPWLTGVLIALGLALVMSSADSLLNGITSLVAVDLRRAFPSLPALSLLRVSRWVTLLLSVPTLVLAARGYSVLYLFLIADLVCAAAAFPVLYGLYSERYTGRAAAWSVVAGLVAGGLLFPDPSFTRGNLFLSVTVGALTPVLVSLLLTPRQRHFDLASLKNAVSTLAD